VGNYDVWHVDFDDSYTKYLSNDDDDWGVGGGAADSGDALMHGEVYQGLLNDYDKVIWLTGDSSGYWQPNPRTWPSSNQRGDPYFATWLIETLTSPEQTYLKSYLDDGKGLFLSGQGILADLGCSGIREADAYVEGGNNTWCERRSGEDLLGIENDFLANYLYITDLHSSYDFGYLSILNEVSDNPVIEEDLTISIKGTYGAENQFFFVDAEPNLDTQIVERIFEYDLTSGGKIPHIGEPPDYPFIGTAGLAYYREDYAYVFLPWGFESIDKQSHRNLVMSAILDWLDNPTITGSTVPIVPTPICGNNICEAGEDAVSCPGDCSGGGGDGGGSSGDGGSLGCFIATACYGTPMAEEVRALSRFRDEYLLANSLGKFFVGTYYKVSPKIADFISEHPRIRNLVRWCLKPVVKVTDSVMSGQ
jgi:hypothetical protein